MGISTTSLVRNHIYVTRQIIIIVGGKLELCGMARHGMLSELNTLRVRKSSPECGVHVLCYVYVEKCGKGFV